VKQNDTPKRIDEMHFDRLTLVYSEYAGKAHIPVNPAAVIVACKGGPVDNPINSALVGAFERLGIARKSKPAAGAAAAPAVAHKDAVTDAGVAESIAEALEDTAISNLYGALYDMEYAVSQVLSAPGFEDAARRAAVDAILETYCAQIAALVAMVFAEKATVIAENATKAGRRHNTEDLAAIQAASDSVNKIVDAAKAAQDATGKLLSDASATEGEKSTSTSAPALVAANEPTVAGNPAAADATKAAIDGVAASVTALRELVQTALDPAALKALIDPAVKSAVEPLQADIVSANQRATDAEARATAAEAAKSAAETTATKAQEDALAAARQRSAPGGHVDPKEARQAQVDANKASIEAAPAVPKTFAEAIRVLHAVTPPAT
jgi:hypothetical protein